jgi:hypothetical protein
MTIVAADWSVDRATGAIRYIGDDHVRFGGTTPSYATVIEFHRWLQDLADDASFAGNDELDITDVTPSERATDNFITLINGYNIDDTAAEHLYDGSIVQSGGAVIYDGIVNFGNPDVQIQIVQAGAVLADDWWNTASGGLNFDTTAGISHRFMLKVRTASADIDLRKVLGTCRRFGKTFAEFSINGTTRGNNVLALADSTDLNNATAEGTVAGWTAIANVTQGYNAIDVNNDSVDEFFYSEWDKSTFSINQFYERMKWLTRDGSAETLYGLSGELFRGITHEVTLTTPRSGTFAAFEAITWSGGTGQMLAIDSPTAGTKLWMQLLTGVPPTNGQTITGASTATATASGTALERPVAKPFCGVSTGSALIGAFGFALESADLSNSDLLTALDGLTYTPPNNVTFSVAGLVVGEDRVLVGPETAGGLNYGQFTLNGALSGAAVTAVVVNGSIPIDTPATGTIRIERADGLYSLHAYTSWTGSTFTIGSTSFAGNNAANGANVFISYIDKLAASTTESFTVVYAGSPRSLFIRVRDGGTVGASPIKTFETTGSLGAAGGSTTAIRTPDE